MLNNLSFNSLLIDCHIVQEFTETLHLKNIKLYNMHLKIFDKM